MGDDQDIVAITAELPPPTEPKRKDKKWRPHPRPGALTRRGPSRPHRRLPEDTLTSRILKLTARMERSKTQVLPPTLPDGLPDHPTSSRLGPPDISRALALARLTSHPFCLGPAQHDDARTLLTKYSHEKTYRLRELLAPTNGPSDDLPEFESVQSTIDPPAPA
jgi:hypothetical protein